MLGRLASALNFRASRMANESEVSVVICSPPFVCATAHLKPNAFPETAKSEAEVAARRLAVLLRDGAALGGEIDKAAAAFLAHLQRNWTPYEVRRGQGFTL